MYEWLDGLMDGMIDFRLLNELEKEEMVGGFVETSWIHFKGTVCVVPAKKISRLIVTDP